VRSSILDEAFAFVRAALVPAYASPSVRITVAFAARWRWVIRGAYSGEAYHFLACSTLGNSMTRTDAEGLARPSGVN
jgi:hypothetical protein